MYIMRGMIREVSPQAYLDVLLNIDAHGKLKTQLYDKRDDFSFTIVNFPYICSIINPARADVSVRKFVSLLLRKVDGLTPNIHCIMNLGSLVYH
jgi:hypothetical protein